MSEQALSEIKERLAKLEKHVEAIENQDLRKINKDICDILDHIQQVYESLIRHWKKIEAIEKYVKQLKQNVIDLHKNELSVEDILNMFPDDDQLEPES
jgi:septal ring factor EnvC (AmiA/AmiB activator)